MLISGGAMCRCVATRLCSHHLANMINIFAHHKMGHLILLKLSLLSGVSVSSPYEECLFAPLHATTPSSYYNR